MFAVVPVLPVCRRLRRIPLTGFLLLFTLVAGAGDGTSPPSYQRTKAKQASIPYYHSQPPQLGAMFRVDRVFTDFEKKGFFRIGLFPFLVAEGVTVEVRQPQRLGEALSAVSGWAQAGRKGRLAEFRGVSFHFQSHHRHVLKADRVRFGHDGAWVLEGVRHVIGEEETTMTVATLQVAGTDAGLLCWVSPGGACARNLLDDPFSDLSRPPSH